MFQNRMCKSHLGQEKDINNLKTLICLLVFLIIGFAFRQIPGLFIPLAYTALSTLMWDCLPFLVMHLRPWLSDIQYFLNTNEKKSVMDIKGKHLPGSKKGVGVYLIVI